MLNNPAVTDMLKNPEMMKNMMTMVKNNPAMQEMLAKQTGMKPEDMVRNMERVQSVFNGFMTVRETCSNKLVQLSLILVFIGVVYRYFL